VGEHPELSKPVNFSLSGVFSEGEKGRWRLVNLIEMSITANQERHAMPKSKWMKTGRVPVGRAETDAGDAAVVDASGVKDNLPFYVQLLPMQVRTYMAALEPHSL
jgi:hypothetical protein